MSRADVEKAIDTAFDNRDAVNAGTKGEVREAVEEALSLLDSGQARVAEPQGNHQWQVNQWLKKAVLLSFRLNDMVVMPGGAEHPVAGASVWWDKVPLKFSGWSDADFTKGGFRAVPGAIVRHSAFIAPSVVLMP
ncbi:MAG: 2,3,4,5-tetrahydropyridine-2,6-dicarboxylate N-succinyltransferase, partial [Candidatus Puniceispirillaceae bacterium]